MMEAKELGHTSYLWWEIASDHLGLWDENGQKPGTRRVSRKEDPRDVRDENLAKAKAANEPPCLPDVPSIHFHPIKVSSLAARSRLGRHPGCICAPMDDGKRIGLSTVAPA